MAEILITDDEESIRYTLSEFLSAVGHTVRTARSFDEAKTALASCEPDLAFVDILLGGSSGLDVLKLIKDKDPDIPVVVITGNASVSSAAEAVRLDAYDYVFKPINKEQLLRLTSKALSHKVLLDERKALLAEKERLQLHHEAVFQSVPDAIVTVDTNGVILQANQALEDVLNVQRTRIVGNKFEDLVNGTQFVPFSRVLDKTLQDRKPVREFRVELSERSEGKRSVVMLNCMPMIDDSGVFIGGVLVVRDISRLAGLERELHEKKGMGRIIGRSRRMVEINNLLEKLAETGTTVLITGPSGTGKELVAEALHYEGPRARNPLVKVNCSALSESLLESELFGHVRGAFTGAIKDTEGRFKLANGGTIFLDEIGDISPRIQLKLLRVLQEKEFERVGDTKTIKVDVRVITATNQNLREMVLSGEFREDLFYRLKVMEVQLPSLEERKEDIALLTEHFLEMFNAQMRKQICGVSPAVSHLLTCYSWPGNIRELKHAIEHAFILCRGPQIELEHLPLELRSVSSESLAVPINQSSKNSMSKADLEQALAHSGGNKAKAARVLGVSRQTIYRKLVEYGMNAVH